MVVNAWNLREQSPYSSTAIAIGSPHKKVFDASKPIDITISQFCAAFPWRSLDPFSRPLLTAGSWLSWSSNALSTENIHDCLCTTDGWCWPVRFRAVSSEASGNVGGCRRFKLPMVMYPSNISGSSDDIMGSSDDITIMLMGTQSCSFLSPLVGPVPDWVEAYLFCGSSGPHFSYRLWSPPFSSWHGLCSRPSITMVNTSLLECTYSNLDLDKYIKQCKRLSSNR